MAPNPELVGQARQATGACLPRWGVPPAVVDAVLLVVSELVTNAIIHGKGQVRLRVFHCEEGQLRVEVRDESRVPAQMRVTGDGDLGGRGLHLVEALSRKWGTSADGRTAWAVLPVRAEAS